MLKPQISHQWKVRYRLILSALFSLIVSFFLPSWFSLSTRILSLWNAGMICFLISTWVLMVQAIPKTMRRNAQSQDEGRLVILSLITASACASILAITFILRETKDQNINIIITHIILAVITIIGSWLLVHTIFAIHYAHEYYQDHKTLSNSPAAGLDFPEDIEPDYWDFLYFAFVIGMTSQVSDVQITSRSLRRLSLFHGILSFFFNTVIVAMSINIIAGLI
ncbi:MULTISPECIES: DUF1345 domain-containing protein [Planktothrix]|jgi:uncharacterized membrane protein|uniref:DUF1345 domain-containing protein n=2 Tax=Planktothrix TaxID=54304 RepID=A0A4P5ZE29_PLAAG|nr:MULTISPECIES: DUF1345 domain-containing protein [Planktothrix]CAD5931989.1 hypothetical protein NO108_01728 [Planktothrix rubescens]CAC5341046.1 putative membrane protein [Planktothrix rubescens NIVA-CYA 18]CAD0231071.1 conserved membrane hypothetical protein [Planktothrix agardhii]CAD5928617.1 hypothetical protein PCC7811_01149 [Planktothrix agardhii]CAD5934992.1 hypothetical protein PCC7821_01532 [Planktothrix rubescens NIVA-CYA 18]